MDFEKHLKKFRTTQRFDVGQKSKYQEMLVRAGKVSDTEIIGIILGEVMQLIMYDCFPVIYD